MILEYWYFCSLYWTLGLPRISEFPQGLKAFQADGLKPYHFLAILNLHPSEQTSFVKTCRYTVVEIVLIFITTKNKCIALLPDQKVEKDYLF